jgi:CHY zinc finger/Zinc-ribbon
MTTRVARDKSAGNQAPPKLTSARPGSPPARTHAPRRPVTTSIFHPPPMADSNVNDATFAASSAVAAATATAAAEAEAHATTVDHNCADQQAADSSSRTDGTPQNEGTVSKRKRNCDEAQSSVDRAENAGSAEKRQRPVAGAEKVLAKSDSVASAEAVDNVGTADELGVVERGDNLLQAKDTKKLGIAGDRVQPKVGETRVTGGVAGSIVKAGSDHNVENIAKSDKSGELKMHEKPGSPEMPAKTEQSREPEKRSPSQLAGKTELSEQLERPMRPDQIVRASQRVQPVDHPVLPQPGQSDRAHIPQQPASRVPQQDQQQDQRQDEKQDQKQDEKQQQQHQQHQQQQHCHNEQQIQTLPNVVQEQKPTPLDRRHQQHQPNQRQQHQQRQRVLSSAQPAILTSFPIFNPQPVVSTTPCCPHYSRNCHLRAPCCNALVACRRCHDALVPDGHPLDRRAVKFVKCLSCDSPDQPLAASCASCGVRFAAYFCAACAMYEDNPNRAIFHCDGCNVCRVGKRADYVHCDTCRACLPSSSFPGHKCCPSVLSGPCAVCKMDMHESVRPCTIMRCGHAMHQGCFEKHAASSYSCLECARSIGDMKSYWDVLDRLLEGVLADVTECVAISCRDCGRESEAKTHDQYRKCSHADCGSYNTVLCQAASKK